MRNFPILSYFFLYPQEINRNDQNAGALLRFVYTYYPPKGKIRFGDDEMKKFFEMQHKPDQRKKVKHLLLKVIQDYHPDKVWYVFIFCDGVGWGMMLTMFTIRVG